MQIFDARYPLRDGYVHNWLSAGPHTRPVTGRDRPQDREETLALIRGHYAAEAGIGDAPVDTDRWAYEGTGLTWRHYRCLEDHLVDLTPSASGRLYLRAWAYVIIDSPVAQQAILTLATYGPADLWLNGAHARRQEHLVAPLPQGDAFPVSLRAGHNALLVRVEAVTPGDAPLAFALRIVGSAPDALTACVPGYSPALARRQDLERLVDLAYLERDVYGAGERIVVRWPDAPMPAGELLIRIQRPEGQTYVEAQPRVDRAAAVALLDAAELADGPYHVTLMPPREVYYEGRLRFQRRLAFRVVRGRFTTAPEGGEQARRVEALQDAATRYTDLYGQIARMALGQWRRVDPDILREAVARVARRDEGSVHDLIGLLGVMYRYAQDPAFPQGLRPLIEEGILGYRYGSDEPGADAMAFRPESRRILFAAGELLAGQLFSQRLFPNAAQVGAWHREKGERLARQWLDRCARGGWEAWDAPTDLEDEVLALAHLADLAAMDEVRELAAVVLDKMLFTLALHSHRGVLGVAHDRASTAQVQGGRAAATASLSRLLWGMGVFNEHLRGRVALACAQGYELPSLIADIAADAPEALWIKGRYADPAPNAEHAASPTREVNRVAYKTPDYMLACAQDYRAGAPGGAEHLWQATLGPDAVVWVNHPVRMGAAEAPGPSFWVGNPLLPRIAQWHDVLVALHPLPPEALLPFTHAYFPTAAFDAWEVGERWAFARVGDGYLALTAAGGLTLVTEGPGAYRELRSPAAPTVWVCQMGRAAQDGSWTDFTRRVRDLALDSDGLAVRFRTLRGDQLAFAWQGAFTVNGREEALGGYRHYDSPYCTAELGAPEMLIRFGDWAMRLDLAQPPDTEPD